MMTRLIYLNDFEYNLTNPLYQAQLMQQGLDEIFYPVCYAYSIFRIFMICVVFVYVKQKLKEILGNGIGRKKVVALISSQPAEYVSIESSPSPPSQSQQEYKSIRFSEEKRKEIQAYKMAIYCAIVLELICALRDFILFRGTLLYTNVMEDDTQKCWIDFYSDSFTCSPNQTVITTWRQFYYNRSECNCMYREPSDLKSIYMNISIISWIITESCTIGIIQFSILILSRLNRKERAGMEFLRPTIYKTIYLTVFCGCFYGIIIYLFDMPIYYRFSNQSVIIFYFFWKLIGFIMIFDRLYSKIWLEKKLRFQSLHSHGIQWSVELDKIKRKMSLLFFDKVGEISIHNQNEKIQDEMKRFITENQYSLREIYERMLNKYYMVSVQPFINKYEREANLKLQTKWHDYLNYMLILNLIGIIGFGSLLIFSFYDNMETLFWIGFVLALIELIVFEISNVVFSLHCFFIELYKNIQLQQAQKEEEQEDEYIEQSQL